MPPSRRRPTPQPGRRPHVAGLRRPGTKPSPRPRPTPQATQDDVSTDTTVEEQFVDGTQSPEEPADVYTDTPDVHEDAPAEPEEAVAPAEEPAEATAVDAEAAEPAELEAPEDEPEAAPLRTPRRKARDTGTARPTSVDEVKVEPEPAKEPEPAASGTGRNSSPLWLAVTLAVVFAVIAGLAAWQYFSAGGVSENKAQADPISSGQAQEEIVAAVQTLFSYDYTKLEGRDDDVAALLQSDKLRKQFATLECAVKDQAPKQKIVTATRVSYSAVTELTDSTAKAIVFVENVWERKSTKQQEASAGSLGVTAQLVGDRWKLTELKVHGGEVGEEPPVPAKCK